jgi:drug/metabolite transporter (DMT)-like permease
MLRRVWIYFALVFCGGIWGLVPTLAKTAVEAGAHPFGLTWWQAVGGGTLVLLITILRGKRLPLDGYHLKFYAFCGLVGTILPTIILFYAARHVSAGVIAILMAAVAIAAYPMCIALHIDTAQTRRVVGLGLGLVGVGFLIFPVVGLGQSDPLWVVTALLIPFAYAAENVYVALKSPRNTDAVTLVTGMLLMGGLLVTPLVIATGTWYHIAWPFSTAEWSVIAIFAINVLSYALFLNLIYAAGPVFASMSGYFAVLTGIIWGMVLLGETHGSWFWVALVSMLAGMMLVRQRAVERSARSVD